MYVVVAGGGKVGANLAASLVSEGHDVTVIEIDRRRTALLAEEYPGIRVIEGDACEPATLEAALIGKAGALAAVTGDDEDNLVVCLLARREYDVPRTAARVNEPKNEWLFTGHFGVDDTVSSTRMMSEILTREVEE